MSENYDDGVKRAWQRLGRNVNCYASPNKGTWHWGLVSGDPLMVRQAFMVREGRHSLHNMIRGDHGLQNRY